MIWNIWPLWIMFSFIFIGIIIKINHFIFTYLSNSVLHKFAAFVTYGYDVVNAILLISSVYTLCASLLNLCCDFNIISFLNRQYLSLLNLSFPFITQFLFLYLFYFYDHHLLGHLHLKVRLASFHSFKVKCEMQWLFG